jgi:GNAT superfamily N-acetyltransferase
MTLTVTTDPARIVALLERLLAADPVGATIFGTIVAEVRAGRAPKAWCAVRPGTDGPDALVVRSHPRYPAVFTEGWAGAELASAIELVRELPDLVGVSGPVDTVEAAVAALVGQQPVGPRPLLRIGLRLFRLDELVPPLGVPGQARPACADDRALLIDWYGAFSDEADGLLHDPAEAVDRGLATGRIWLWCDGGRPVSLAARRAPEAGSARIGPVYTPPEQRGHGYASAATAAATSDILELGAVPVLFTDLSNPTSNRIYQQLGYRPVADRLQVMFRRSARFMAGA